MNKAELKLVEAMTPWRRVAKFRPMFKAGTITEAQYDFIIQRIPYTTAIEEGSDVGTDVREHGNGVGVPDDQADGHDSEGGEGRGEADAITLGEQVITPVQFVDSLLVRGSTDGDIQPGTTAHTDKKSGKSQKAKLLDLLIDYQWHTTREICKVVYGSEHFGGSRYAARVRDLKDDGWDITDAEHVEGTVYKYRLIGRKISEAAKNIASG